MGLFNELLNVCNRSDSFDEFLYGSIRLGFMWSVSSETSTKNIGDYKRYTITSPIGNHSVYMTVCTYGDTVEGYYNLYME